MTLKIDIDPQTEESLEKAASRKGIAAEQMAAEVISDRFAKSSPGSMGEGQLLAAINEGWPESRWLQYRELVDQRDRGSISQSELALSLIHISEPTRPY